MLNARNAPTDGRYSRYSLISIGIGTMLDSTDRVMKNQKMPKATTAASRSPVCERYRRYSASRAIDRSNRNDDKTCGSEKERNTG